MPATTPGGLPYPLDDDPASDGNEAIQALAEAVEEALAAAGMSRGTLGARPAFGADAPPFYFATDEHALYVNVTTRWALVATILDDVLRLPDLSATDETLIYTGEDLTSVEYRTQDGTLRARDVLAYTGADLTTVTRTFYDLDGATVLHINTETVGYTAGKVTTVGRVIA